MPAGRVPAVADNGLPGSIAKQSLPRTRLGNAVTVRYHRPAFKRSVGRVMLNVLFPSPYSVEVSRLRQQLDEAHLAWATEWKRQQLEFRIENIRFAHDPRWNRRFFSLQAARDGGTWFWRGTHMVVGWSVLSI